MRKTLFYNVVSSKLFEYGFVVVGQGNVVDVVIASLFFLTKAGVFFCRNHKSVYKIWIIRRKDFNRVLTYGHVLGTSTCVLIFSFIVFHNLSNASSVKISFKK